MPPSPELEIFEELTIQTEKLGDIKEAIENIPQSDLSPLIEKLSELSDRLVEIKDKEYPKFPELKVDFVSVISKLDELKKSLKQETPIELPIISEHLNDIHILLEEIKSKNVDLKPIESYLKGIAELSALIASKEFKIPENIIERDRIKVVLSDAQIDKIIKGMNISVSTGGGGSGGYVKNSLGAQINPATSEKQDTGNTSLDAINTKLTDTLASGSLTALDTTVEIDMNGQGSVSFQIAGTWAGTIVLEATVDSTNWSSIIFFPSGFANNYKNSTTANGQFRAVAPMGFAKLRLRMSAYTSGTATVTINASLTTQETTGFFGVVSVVNSTTTPLGIAGTFTGSFEDILDFSSVSILVFANVAGTLYLDFSTDGVNTDHTETYTVTANGLNIVAMAEGRYVRARYVNGGTGQTTFRMLLLYRKSILISEILPIDTALLGTMDSLIVRAIIAGKKPNGDYTNVQTTTAGNLKVSIEEQDAGAGLATSANQTAIITKIGDQLSDYKISNIDADASPNYYSFQDKAGNYYFLKEVVSAGADTYTYWKGTGDYANDWTARASKTYDYFYNIF